MAVGVAFIYHEIGIAAIALFGVVLVTFQYLLGQLLLSQQRAEELERRTKQLASFQVGMLSALLRTLDLRDQMTARHSAAVARYSRAIAQRAGMSRRDQELVHIAALLHDIGKFILPDRILKANVPLTEEDWMLIRRHPQQGARVVSLAGRLRAGGRDHPRPPRADRRQGLSARADRRRHPRDGADHLGRRHLRRDDRPRLLPRAGLFVRGDPGAAAGRRRQLDARFVEIFIELLEGKDLTFRHGEDADFERELALEARIEEAATPDRGRDRFLVGGQWQRVARSALTHRG